MASEFPYLTADAKGKYVPYINALQDEYDFVAPQYYNQNGDGLWVDEANAWISQNNDELKEDFLYYLTDSLVTGTRGFAYIPAHKFAIGLPGNVDAAANGYVIDPSAVENALQGLESTGNAIRGLMTRSVNWDVGTNRDGRHYRWEFRDRYAPLIHGKDDSTSEQQPERENGPGRRGRSAQRAPRTSRPRRRRKRASHWAGAPLARTRSSATRSIGTGASPARPASLKFDDKGLKPDTEYSYFVTATDSRGTESLPSSSLRVKTRQEVTEPPDTEYPAWRVDHHYRVGDKVSYQRMTFRCIHEHTSNAAWTPAAAGTLWTEVAVTDPESPYPEWRPNRHYRKVDGVTYRGKKYLCTEEHTSSAAWTPYVARTLWTQVVEFVATPA